MKRHVANKQTSEFFVPFSAVFSITSVSIDDTYLAGVRISIINTEHMDAAH